ncbi:hypothetical protein [Burkholderia ubonensis]|uniref:hypothetical protein n=1 Tax=Burkholderia ubonensis TaxID=101571 RepID=UPI0012FB64DB|nr:hypothetical protein [Burkholderia ubonensis]
MTITLAAATVSDGQGHTLVIGSTGSGKMGFAELSTDDVYAAHLRTIRQQFPLQAEPVKQDITLLERDELMHILRTGHPGGCVSLSQAAAVDEDMPPKE